MAGGGGASNGTPVMPGPLDTGLDYGSDSDIPKNTGNASNNKPGTGGTALNGLPNSRGTGGAEDPAEDELGPMANATFVGAPPEQVAGLSNDELQDTTAASMTPGAQAASAEGLGVSTAAGAIAAEGEKKPEPPVANKAIFQPDLAQGAVAITGSDLNSALSELADVFGSDEPAVKAKGALTAEEEAAFSSLGRKGGKGAGREVAQAGNDPATLDEDSVALFVRVKFCHDRALKRGNVDFGLRKRL
jgi:hypothetical protein